ncbi:MAG TPA: hypothetical protein VFE78_21430 [Gemmataceae bacterium]|nr:hypothetical protein [Gemmataceae bacterium]
MPRLRLWSVLILAALPAPALRAQDKAPSPWAIDRTLSVSPRAAPVPALKYRLLPLSSELKEGNAVPIYLRLIHEQSDATQKYWTETPRQWNKLPVDKLPVEQIREFLRDRRFAHFPRQLELAARRRTTEWNYTLDDGNPIGLLLPDVQIMRTYAPLLVLQVRLALAEGDFPKAAHRLETCFAFSRHVGDGPTLVHSMAAFALASQFTDAVGDFVERPGAPNLYWALTALPRPLLDPRGALGWEYHLLENQFPELGDLDRARTAEQWDGLLRRVRAEVRAIALSEDVRKPPQFPDWFPKHYAPEDTAAKSPDLAAARKSVARSKGLSADKVEAMPPAQVLLLYLVDTYHEKRDDLYRGFYLPYPRAFPLFEAATGRLRQAPTSEGAVLARMFLPDLPKVISREARLERSLAALRVIEALRLYAAAHDGRLPDKLIEVTEAPLPNDPGTGRPFEYSRDGDAGALVGRPLPGDPLPNNGIRYRVTLRKK